MVHCSSEQNHVAKTDRGQPAERPKIHRPKTSNGQAVSKMNALKHGILSNEMVAAWF
jgi:hypothetical protein